MREYVVGSNSAPKYIRALVGGRVNSGKTHFAATFPKPRFISDAAEGGAKTLETMDPAFWWDSRRPPNVSAIEDMLELPQLVTRLLGQKGKSTDETLVVDSISIYAQRVLRELKSKNPGQDGRQRYGELADALSAQVARIHSLPMHVVWLCHIDEEMQLTVPGKATSALWAYMDYKWMTHVEARAGQAPDYQLHIRPFLRATWLGGRSQISAPSPIIPSFKVLAELLGLSDVPPSPACPDFGGMSFRDGASYMEQGA